MSENNKKFEQEAKAFFADGKNKNVNVIYATSDGNLFRAEHYADNWKTQLTDKAVEVYHRNPAKTESTSGINSTDQNEDIDDKSKGSEGNTDAVREELVKQYIELFDTKPAHNIGLDKLQDKITAKRFELAKEAEGKLGDAGKENE